MIFQLVLLIVILFLMFYAKIQTAVLLAAIAALCGLFILARARGKHEHGAFLSIDAAAQRSKMRVWHGGLKIALSLLSLFACIAVDSLFLPVYLFCAAAFVTIVIGKIPGHYYIELMAIPAVFILLSCLAILIQIMPEPAGVLSVPVGNSYLCVTEQAQYLAAKTALRALGAVGCLYMLSLSTPVYHIIAGLRSIKLPAVIIDLMYLIYRYLFILLETHQQMVHASEARLGYRNTRTAIRTMTKNALALMFISMRRTSDMLSAMEARCYDGDIRFIRRRYKAGKTQVCASAAMLIGAVTVTVLERRI